MLYNIYDAGGERVLKTNNDNNVEITINGTIATPVAVDKLDDYVTYVNPYYVLRKDYFTTHFYIEGERVATKLSEEDKDLGLFFHHKDYLGSAAYTTGISSGETTQHIEYFPFGETFIDEKEDGRDEDAGKDNPYRYNSKELDQETGLYYYGGRYYDPRTSTSKSVYPLATYDPIMNVEQYVDGQHNNGVFNSGNLAVYGYTYQNPVRFIDSNGKQVDITIISTAVGSTQLRFIGSENLAGAPATVTVCTYRMSVTDKATGTITNYEVTRESLVATGIDYDWFSANEYEAENRAFEPKNEVGEYTAVALSYPSGTDLEALALRESGSGRLAADPNRIGDEQGFASGIMIHVGGNYQRGGASYTVGSLGCFGLAGSNEGNAGIKNFIGDVVNRRNALRNSGMDSSINVTIQKRGNVDWNWLIDSSGEKDNSWLNW